MLRVRLRPVPLAALVSACTSWGNGYAPVPPAAPLPGASAVLVGAGDIARCESDGDERTARLVDSVLAAERGRGRAIAVFTTGDNVYPTGSADDFRMCYGRSWGRDSTVLGATFPAVGNHEYRTDGAAPYFAYFGHRAGPPGRGYYSYDLGPWHIIVLNSEIIADSARASAQEAWLRGDLSVRRGVHCTLAYWHRPRFSSGRHGGDAALRGIWEILYAAQADVGVSGHDHDYERFGPQTPTGVADSARGLVQFVAGTGGAQPRGFRHPPAAHSRIRISGRLGVLKLELADEEYQWEFIATGGRVYDTGRARCH